MHLSKDEQIIYNHYQDMYNLSYRRGIPVFSDFAGLNEINLAYSMLEAMHLPKEIHENRLKTFGGYENAERRVLAFLPENDFMQISEQDFQISCVKLSAVNKKFSDKLTHRDFLGTVLGLGLERSQIGDIVITQEGQAGHETNAGFVFCKKNKAELLTGIERIKHTTVRAEIVDGSELVLHQQFRESCGSVSSLRLDAVIAVALHSSRSQCLAVIRDGNVYLNGRCCTENAKNVKSGDIITIRGYGKCIVETSETLTKKGRFHITVKQYV